MFLVNVRGMFSSMRIVDLSCLNVSSRISNIMLSVIGIIIVN